MKKYVLVMGVTLLTTVAVMATVLSGSQKPSKEKSKDPVKKECKMKKSKCSRMMSLASY